MPDTFITRYGFVQWPVNPRKHEKGNRCELCGYLARTPRELTFILCFDHCHAHGQIRGILCRKCNVSLKYAIADVQAGITESIDSRYWYWKTQAYQYLTNCQGCSKQSGKTLV